MLSGGVQDEAPVHTDSNEPRLLIGMLGDSNSDRRLSSSGSMERDDCEDDDIAMQRSGSELE